jgi:cytochrome b pre-mRNA-processing protein 3
MISLPFGRPKPSLNIDALYGMIVAQARSPSFYRDYGVADTVTGRLDMIMLHLVLVLRQMSAAQEKLPPAGQALFDRFCQDMDDNFREMGVGDLTVPKEMLRVAEAFYGRSKAYETALTSDDVRELETVVARNVFGSAEPPLGARQLAAYVRMAAQRLGGLTPEALVRAEFVFPDPEAAPQPAPQGV